MKTVYTCFCTDVIHAGHLNIINEAKKLGSVTVGALSDKALIRYNRFPTVSQEERIRLYEALDGVDRVVIQDDMLYDGIIDLLKPDYVVHGDNWKTGPEGIIRDSVVRALKKYGGELVEVAYTCSEDVRKTDLRLKEKLAMPEYRRRNLFKCAPLLKLLRRTTALPASLPKKPLLKQTASLTSLTRCGFRRCAIPPQKVSPILNLLICPPVFKRLTILWKLPQSP